MTDRASNLRECDSDLGLIDHALAQTARSREILAYAEALPEPSSFPGYTIHREVRRGGQGVVYEATQQATGRRIAIKVIRDGSLAGGPELARFRREIAILAQFTHPNIVRLYDGGAAEGRPYYVMDYVDGRPLDDFAQEERLGVRDAVSLMVKVASAVHAAHLRGIVHRDLKPSNIRVDDRGEPQILDFGLAKLEPANEATTFGAEILTVTGQFMGSMPWAAPEQVDGLQDNVDVRTDVYAIGVMLFQAITGRFPYDVGGSMRMVMDNIMHASPPRPSALRPGVNDDLDTIVLRCLSKDRNRRYQSARELAHDLEHYLRGEPIDAKRDSMGYVLRKQLRLHWRAVAAVLFFALLLSAGSITSLTLWYRAERALAEKEKQTVIAEENATTARKEAERADREAAQTRAVAEFQAQMLSDIDPQAMGVKLRADLLTKARAAGQRTGRSTEEIDARLAELENLIAGVDLTGLALTALDENIFQKALAAIEKQFAHQPLVQARLLQTVASTLHELGLLDDALRPQEQALEIRRQALGDKDLDTLTSISGMGQLRLAQGMLEEAEPYLRDVVQSLRRLQGDKHVDTLKSIVDLGYLLQERGRLDEAEALYREAMENLRRVAGDDHPDTLMSISILGALLLEQNRLEEAELYLYEALNTRRRVLGEEHRDTLNTMNSVATLLQAQGKLDEAEAYYRESLKKHRRALGDEHPNTLSAIANMGFVLRVQGRLTEVEPYYLEALDKRRRLLGDDHPDTITSIHNMGFLLQAQGRFGDAEAYCREAMDRWRRLLGDEHPDTLIAINNMGLVLLAQGKLSEAEPFCREALEKRRRVRGEEHLDTLVSVTNMGSLLHAQNKPAEAIALMIPLEPAARREFAGNPVRLGRFLTPLGCARATNGEFEAAEANLSEAHTILTSAKGATARDRTDVLGCLVALYQARHTVEPERGYDTSAAEWRAKLNRLGVSSPQTASPRN